MSIVREESLGVMLDELNERFFYEKSLRRWEREQAAKWIAGRQGLPRSYGAAFFAPTKMDFQKGVRLFTGEAVRSGAATAHILGEEACRALTLLNVPGSDVQGALRRAHDWLRARKRDEGMYCCGTCSVAYWRNLSVSGVDGAERRLAAGMKALRARRAGQGRWRTFPFHYALLALNEIESRAATDELRYAAPECERLLKRARATEPFGRRRRAVMERALARV